MLRRFLSVILILCMLNTFIVPAFAQESEKNVKAEFQTELNVNKASEGQVVQFVTVEDYDDNGVIIPKGTIISGHIKSFKKGRWAYRRAKVRIVIDKIILPSGQIYNVKGATKRPVLKGSVVKNIAKGIVTFPLVIVTGVAGTCVIIVEAVSIVGILLIGPTSYLASETMGKLSHGVNCQKHPGDTVKLKINSVQNMSE